LANIAKFEQIIKPKKMLSRVANSIYWMNRYIERVENYARFVSVNINLSYDLPGISKQWGLLLDATHDKDVYDNLYGTESQDQILHFVTFDALNPNSIFNILGNARENARTVKETLPKEVWEHLNAFYLNIKQISTTKQLEIDELPLFYENIKQQCQLFSGMIEGTLVRNEAFYFANLGKFLERADKTSRFLDIGYFNFNAISEPKTANPQDLLVWSAVLKSVSAFNMYRQQYKSLKQENIIEFLIKDREFPRAICHSIKKAEYALYRISGARPQDSYSNEAEKALSQLKHDIDFTETSEIIKTGLHKFLNDFQVKCNQIDNEIFKVYFDLDAFNK
jgi:uncharacterized alpha-E superfamily protein